MIFRYFRKIDWLLLAVTVVLIFIQVYLEIEIPGYMNRITTIMTTGGTSEEVMQEGVWMIGCAFGSLVTAVIVVAIGAYVGTNIGMAMRRQQFENVERFSASELNRFSIYSLITRSTNDVNQVQLAFIIGMMVVIRAPMMAAWALMKISTKNIEWSWATVVAVVAMMIFILSVMKFVFPCFKRIQWLNDDVNRITKEGLNGIRVVHAYNAEGFQEKRFEEANKTLTDTHLSITRALAFMQPAMGAVMSMLTMAIYLLGAIIINGIPTVQDKFAAFSDMIVFSSYAVQVIMSFMMLLVLFFILPRALVAAKRIREVIDVVPEINDGGVRESPEGMEGKLSFRDVYFRYPGSPEDALVGVSFDIEKGETLAIIGSTGSGKSTLVRMIPRFFDVTEGQILLDGVDIRDYDLDVLRRKVGYVPQKAMMFNGTIESNVNYGDTEDDRTSDDVKNAVSIAQGKEFIEKMDKQYQSIIAEGGTNLSGGQKQRISIARAVCKRPEFYIFDDSFSALDYKTDRKLRSELKKETAGVTTIIVAQRIGTIMDADKILVLDEGAVVGMGTHEELLRDCEVYRQIAASQLTDEELVR